MPIPLPDPNEVANIAKNVVLPTAEAVGAVLGAKPIANTLEHIATGSFDALRHLLARVCNPAFEEFGQMGKEYFARRRENVSKVAEKANAILDAQKKEKTQCPPRILMGLLDRCKDASDDPVQDYWAGLLAAACSETGEEDDDMVFINLLSQMSTPQVLLLEFLVANSQKVKLPNGAFFGDRLRIKPSELMTIARVQESSRIRRALTVMETLRLITFQTEPFLPYLQDEAKLIISVEELGIALFVRSKGFRGDVSNYFIKGFREVERDPRTQGARDEGPDRNVLEKSLRILEMQVREMSRGE